VRDNRSACVLVRPQLMLLDSVPVSLGVLTNVKFTLSSVDGEGVSSQKVFHDVALSDVKDLTFEFPVPYALRSLTCTLTAEVRRAAHAL
jgi:hypothetical protein